jgi:heme-degrading monooxygenase HmoA
MYAVIFRAEIRELDESYFEMVARMRELALSKYGCTEFIAVTEGNQEIAISYWPSLAQIEIWRQDLEHLVAQELGRSKWYASFRVQTVEIIRQFGSLESP